MSKEAGAPLAGAERVDAAIQLAEVRARARAAFLGLALGDALGAPVEFMTRAEIRAAHGVLREPKGGGWLRLRVGQVTDDTEMSLVLGRALVERGGLDLRAAATALAAWMRGGPPDVGNTVRRGLRRFLLDGSLEGPRQEGDAGNGAAMRMVPVAIATLGDPALLARWAVAQGRLTHHHPLSDAACVAVGELLQRACLGGGRAALAGAAAALVEREPRFRFAPYRGLATGYVVDTLQTVLHHVLREEGFEATLVAVVNEGGDADTTGAIAGAVAGALYGPEALPRRWLARLDRTVRDEAERLAGALLDLSPLARARAQGPAAARAGA